LDGIGADLAKAEAAAKTMVENADAEKAARDTAVTSAQENESMKKEALVAKEAEAKAAAEELSTATSKLKEAEAAEKTFAAEFADAEKSKDIIETAQAKITQMMEAAGASPEVKEVVAACKKLGIEEELTYLPEALKKEPATRGPFEAIILNSVDELLAKSLSKVSEVLKGGEAGKADCAAAVEAAKVTLAAATEKKATLKIACRDASSELHEVAKTLTEAKAAVSSYASDMKQAGKELAAASKAFVTFNNGALASFNHLKNNTTPPPEEPKVVEEVPVETTGSASASAA
jgi:hypothetical protein